MLLSLGPEKLDELLLELPDDQLAALAYDFHVWGRTSQVAPPGDWRVWLLLAGRGFGKTRSGAEWVRMLAEEKRAKRIALVAPTAQDLRNVMIEGESGILAISHPKYRPSFEPSRLRLEWSDGAVAYGFSADEPDRLRGPQHDAAWCDEVAAWRHPEAWDMMMMGLRLGSDPRVVATTTPKPTALIRRLASETTTVVTKGTSWENKGNLAPAFLAEIVKRYEGTRLGRQELEAEILDDTPNALWTREMIERARVDRVPPFLRVVVAIDPAVTSSRESDETGIVVAAIGNDRVAYVLEDASDRHRPEEWARRAIALYRKFGADRVVGETNNGGDLVEATLRAVDRAVSYKGVRASRGKVVRAEPVAALYEQGRVKHRGAFPTLEDQMCAFTSDFDRARADYSPDRVDALVWAITELMVAPTDTGLLEYYAELSREKNEPQS